MILTKNIIFKFFLILAIFNLSFLHHSHAQGVDSENTDEGGEDQANFGKPIRPVQNSTFYPNEDPDANMDKCLVAEFRYLALNTSDPILRKQKAEAWVRNNSKYCNIAKLVSIRNNRAQWLGTSDSATIDAELGKQLEIAGEASLEMQAALYGLKLPPSDDEEDQE